MSGTGIRVIVDIDSMGYMSVTPLSDKIRNKIKYYLKSMNVTSNGSAFIQNDVEQNTFKERYMPAHKVKDLNRGWSQNINIDAWEFLHFFGWDSHLLAETGELWK